MAIEKYVLYNYNLKLLTALNLVFGHAGEVKAISMLEADQTYFYFPREVTMSFRPPLHAEPCQATPKSTFS